MVVEASSASSYTLDIDEDGQQWQDLWVSLSKNCLDCFQPFDELGDNAIAAIIKEKGATGSIYYALDFESQRGSVEHSGGTTFPQEDKAFARCIRYAGLQPTSLNEHGCGLKASLATLNPTNDAWKIWIKYLDASGALRFKSVRAPWARVVHIQTETAWPGVNQTAEPGTFIEFPVTRERFVDLYTAKDKAKMRDLDERIICHFSHAWMKQEHVLSGRVRLYYNGAPITPFSFTTPAVFEHIEQHHKDDFCLEDGGHVFLEEYKLKPTAKSTVKGQGLPGSYKFRYAMEANGIVLFKNGRWIESIHSDEPGRRLYSRILGARPHHNHNGHIKLVNLVGPQEALPPTVPTKNRFAISALFDELVTLLHTKIHYRMTADATVSEDSIVDRYKAEKETRLASVPGLRVQFEREKVYTLPDGTTCPPVDLVMECGGTVELMEFKPVTKPQVSHFAQLFMNWSLATAALPDKDVRPVLVLVEGDNNGVSDAQRQYLEILETRYHFTPEVRTTSDKRIYPV